MNRKKSIHLILWKYKLRQPLSPKEEAALYKWVAGSELHQQLFDELSNDDYWDNELAAFNTREGDPVMNIIDQRLEDISYFEKRNLPVWKKYTIAATVLVLVTGGVFTYKLFTSRTEAKHDSYVSKIEKTEDVLPASDNAVLRLGDNSLIDLDKANKEMLTMQRFGMFISVEDGWLVYRTEMSTKTEEHTLITPKATQYKLKLPDGTKVWLNAGSSLKFPTTFGGSTREVKLTGEGYFEVSKMAAKKFIVRAGNTRVNVLGTHFNINAYSEDGAVVTTLLEGSVQVATKSDSVKLVPGEKVSVRNDADMKVAKTDVNQITAWKEKLFWFQDESIPEIMKQIERWYNVKVVFKGNTSEIFTGILPRDLTLGQILSVLDSSGKFSFEVKNKTITVVP